MDPKRDFSKNYSLDENKKFVLYLFHFILCHIDVNLYKKEEIKDEYHNKKEIIDDQENIDLDYRININKQENKNNPTSKSCQSVSWGFIKKTEQVSESVEK